MTKQIGEAFLKTSPPDWEKTTTKFEDNSTTARLREILEYLKTDPHVKRAIKSHKPSEKNNSIADGYRNSGNKFLKTGEYQKALLEYNKGFKFAVHPPPKRDKTFDKPSDASPYKSLSYLYIRRSEVFFHTGMFGNCLEDIRRAAACGYEKYDKTQLVMYCSSLIQLDAKNVKDNTQQHNDLEYYFTETKKLIENIEFDCEQKKYFAKEIKTAFSQSESTEEADPVLIFAKSAFDKHGIQEVVLGKVPTLSNSTDQCSKVSSDIKVESNEKLGRHFVATCDIYPGTILVNEDIYASVPYYHEVYCALCLAPCRVMLIPCPTCTLVVFCSEGCRTKALLTTHRHECKFLHVYREFEFNTVSAIRILSKVGLPQLKRLTKVDDSGEVVPTEDMKSSDYCGIFNMIYHDEKFALSKVLSIKYWSMVIVATFFLRAYSNFFGRKKKKILIFENWEMSADEELIAKLMFRHLKNSEVNGLGGIICQMYPNSDGDFTHVNAGGVMAEHSSIFSHSCCPNAMWFVQNGKIFVRALGFINEGEVVNVTYVGDFSQEEKVNRQVTLERMYSFKCHCVACKEEWHPLDCECDTCENFEFKLKCLNHNKCKGILKFLLYKGECSICKSSSVEDKLLYPESFLSHIREVLYYDSDETPPEIATSELIPLTAESLKVEFDALHTRINLNYKLEGVTKKEMLLVYKFKYLIDNYATDDSKPHLYSTQTIMLMYHLVTSARIVHSMLKKEDKLIEE